MNEQLRYKIEQAEITPPAENWAFISDRLHREYDVAESRLAVKLQHAQLTPPDNCWVAIRAALHQKKSTRLISLPALRMLAAAAVLVLVSVSAFYFFNANLPQSFPEQNAAVPAIPFPDVSEQLNSDPEDLSSIPTTGGTSNTNHTQSRSGTPKEAPQVLYAAQQIAEDNFVRPYTRIDRQKLLVNTAKTITVDAPPIRDERGNIILDLDLVSTENNQYVIVTSPGGEQTRISRKFAPVLTYLNEEAVPLSLSIDALEWKFRFQEWRNRLLAQASFIPTAANFLDIFELKNLIDEHP